MKKIYKNLLKLTISLIVALVLTVFLYWPLYQKIPLNNFKSDINDEVSNIKQDLPLGEDFKEILDRKFYIPKDKYKLCLENRNRFYLIHADSDTPGVPFEFKTDDLARLDYGKKYNLGAMAIALYYTNNQSKDEIYRKVGEPKQCINLDATKLQNYTSSTIEYRYIMSLSQIIKSDFGEQGKVIITHQVLKGYLIDTTNSLAYIVPRWWFFIFMLVSLFGILIFILSLPCKIRDYLRK